MFAKLQLVVKMAFNQQDIIFEKIIATRPEEQRHVHDAPKEERLLYYKKKFHFYIVKILVY